MASLEGAQAGEPAGEHVASLEGAQAGEPAGEQLGPEFGPTLLLAVRNNIIGTHVAIIINIIKKISRGSICFYQLYKHITNNYTDLESAQPILLCAGFKLAAHYIKNLQSLLTTTLT